MLDIATIVAPVFLVVLTGYGSAKLRLVSDAQVDSLLHFTIHVAVTALLLRATATLDLDAAMSLALLSAYYLPAFVSFTIGCIAAQRLFGQRPGESIASGFTALFANSLFLGLPIVERAYGPPGLVFGLAIVAVHAPVMYTVGVLSMESVARDGAGAGAALRKIARTLSRNPMFVSAMTGLAWNVIGIGLHPAIEDALALMAGAALPLGMFGIGATLTRYALGGDLKVTVFYVALTLLVRPLLVLAAALLLGLTEMQTKAVVIMAAMPGGVNIYLFATLYQRAQMLAANALLIGTALGIFTVSAWLALLS